MSVIKTDRLILRPLTDNDAQEMFKNWTWDSRVAKYCRWHPHKSIEETKELLKMYKSQAENGFDYRWGITLKKDNSLIGVIDVIELSEDKKTAEVGYVLTYDYWNNGYLTEALKAVIKILFSDGIEKVIADHHIDNIASGRVMEKCGMKFTHYSKAKAKFGSDELCDVKCYEIIK
ncbi:MAG: GNAT family N-acetyltransferase [Ruminococcaceae bacterium]|nr:GNAT family N-acetyltransferase [Oscillospiraceae bacterium]